MIFWKVDTVSAAIENYYLVSADIKGTVIRHYRVDKKQNIKLLDEKRTGKKPFIIPVNENQFKASVLVSVSPQFFGWVAGVGKGMEILGPQDVRNEYKKYLEEMLDKYKKM